MICKNCGNENKENANFCKYCGTKLEKMESFEPKEEKVLCEEVKKEENCNNEQEKIETHIDVDTKHITIKKHEVIIEDKPEPKRDEVEEKLEPLKPVSRMQEAINNLSNKSKKCPACGMLIIDNARFCTNCGLKIN